MANGSIIVNNGKTIILSRSYDSTETETVPSRFSVGISNGTPDVADTALDVRIPISDGTVNDDGDNQMTGSNGGANSTDNTSTFKPGAGVSDDVAQNLVTDGLGANATKTWTITDLSVNGVVMTATEPFALWLYIDDAADLAKFVAAGTALEIRLGSDSTNYYK